MRTTLSERGQTAVPARIRERLHLKPGQQLEWVESGDMIYILPVSKDPIKSFRGSSPGLFKVFMKYRNEERKKEKQRDKRRGE